MENFNTGNMPFSGFILNDRHARQQHAKVYTGLPFSLRSSGDAVLYFSMLLVRIHTSVQEGFVFCQALIRRMYGDARRSHGAEVVRIESGLPVGFLQVVGGQSYRGEKKARATNNFSDYFVLLVDQPNTV